MVVTTDLVDSLVDLHPAYKWEVGRRLALWALAKDYGKAVLFSGPVYKGMEVKKDEVDVSFEYGSLISRDGKPLSWWEVAGADGRFVPVVGVIRDDKVILKGVNDPVAVRFGWNEAAQPNLFNAAGLPAMPFRTKIKSEK
jgi:sialate O-acetylesterase